MKRMLTSDPQRARRRFNRQFRFFGRQIPAARRPLNILRHPKLWMVRVPVSILLVLGGFLAILPVFGLWMIPLGLLLLAIDVPKLQAPVSDAIVRARLRWREWRRSIRQRR